MTRRDSGEPKQLAIDELHHHPKNAEFYGEPDDITDLVASIEDTGFDDNEPIEIIQEPRSDWPANRIVSGHRRHEAARQAGLDKVPVRTVGFEDEDEELKYLLQKNRYRQKTDGMLIREGVEYERMIREDSIEVEGRVDETVANRIGMGKSTYVHGRKVMRAAETGMWGDIDLDDDDHGLAKEQWEELKADDQSIHGAWSTVDEAVQGEGDETASEFGRDDDDNAASEFGRDGTKFPLTAPLPESIRDVVEKAAEDAGHESLGDHLSEVYLEYLHEEGYLPES